MEELLKLSIRAERNKLKSGLQARAHEFCKTHKNCLIEMCTGTGKSWVMGLNIKHNWAVRNNRLQIVIVPTELLRDVNMVKEFTEQGIDVESPNLQIHCYASIKKLSELERPFDLHLDEGHHITELVENVMRDCAKKGTIKTCIAYSATIPEDKRKIFEGLGMVQSFKYSLIEAIKDGVLPKTTLFLHKVYLDTTKDYVVEYTPKTKKSDPKAKTTVKGRTTVEKKSFKTSEAEAYKYLETQYETAKTQMKILGTQIYRTYRVNVDWFSDRNDSSSFNAETNGLLKQRRYMLSKLTKDRIAFVNNSRSKNAVAMEVIEELRAQGKRFAIFHQSIDAIEKMTPHTVHSKKKSKNEYGIEINESVLKQFNSKEISEIGAVEMLNEGHSLADIDSCVIVAFTAKSKSFVQRFGRTVRADDEAHIHLIMLVGTRDEESFDEICKDLGDGFDDLIIVIDHSTTKTTNE